MQIETPPLISIVLDKRRVKTNGKFPVKLRVYFSATKKQKLYNLNLEYSEKDFNSIWNTSKTRVEYKEDKIRLNSIEEKAIRISRELSPFDFDQFEKRLFRSSQDGSNISYHYDQIIKEKIELSNLSTADVYKNSRQALRDYCKEELNKDFDSFRFQDITSDWLNKYEQYMTNRKKRSINTVSIYLRALKTVYNKAIDEKDIEKDYLPFGKRKYQIPSSTNVKRALSEDQLAKLLNCSPLNYQQEKARDFWFFSFACNGMNVKDIAQLRFKDIEGDRIVFYRSKTLNTSKANLKPISVYLNDFALSVIEKYGSTNKSPEKLVFDILEEGLNAHQQRTKIKVFTRFINQHIKKLAMANGLTENISTYWARHSFATRAIRKGASMEFMQESLGHKNLKTTQNYFAGFDNETRKEFAQSLMDFRNEK
ncbi:tyrosine-type recombinase/integrase [Roseivirga pacifica]